MENSLDNYKLSCELLGHSMDVRSVSCGPVTEGQEIISGSRDKTVKVWKLAGNEYVEKVTYKDHKNFVSCVYYLESEHWICTGSNDSTICLYQEESYVPILTLKGHESTVCSLAQGIDPRSIISGSWDKTARVWTIDQLGNANCLILRGHEASVWAVTSMIAVRKYITGSADKCIYYWNDKGEKLRMLKGHTDCVRGVLALSDNSLLSCANDAVIRYWNEDGECVQEMNGHTNYIYSMAQNAAISKNVILTCGEDSTLRMWNIETGTELGNPITHPAQSVWSVTCLSNGDIVTGASDGVIRVFSSDPKRYANTAVLNAFQLAVAARTEQINQELGGIKKTELPGPESLLTNGTKEGQTKIVRHPDGSVKCYNWELGQWKLVGDVTGAAGGTQGSSGKTLFDGKEYDFVFSVDVSDTEPPKKLPYNRGEDPWHVAQAFIHRHNLPQTYLEQVAAFIIKNSSSDSNAPANPTTSGYQDPFTGGARYIPGSNSNNTNELGNVDPFTGASSYSTTNLQQPRTIMMKGTDTQFPVASYLTFDHCDPIKVLEKLKEFNKKLVDDNQIVSENLLQTVVRLAEENPEVDNTSCEALRHLLMWPSEILFPVLDITRLAIRNESIFVYLNSSNFLDENIILQINSTIAANQLMSVRCLVNMMNHNSGRKEVNRRLAELVARMSKVNSGSTNMQIALATFYLNATILQIQGSTNGGNCELLTSGIVDLLNWATDLEACYRSMQAIGNLTTTAFSQETIAQVISVDHVMDKIRTLSNTPQKDTFEKLNLTGSALLERLLKL